jgi:phage recombination protein Bet
MSEAIVRSVNAVPATRQQVAPMEFSADQLKIIRDSFLNGASEKEAAVLLELARVRRLNPITRQIHFVKRSQWDPDTRTSKEVWSAQVGIDGFRAIAERTGLYDGQDEAEFEYDSKGAIKLCRVRIYRKDWSRPAVGVAHFTEYAQTKKDGSLTKMWVDKPHIMIAKCAEALAFRKAFPEDTSGLYAPEEMGVEREEKDITPIGPPTANTNLEQPRTKALAEKVAARMQPKLPIMDEPPPELESPIEQRMRAADPYASHKPVEECTDQELKAREGRLLEGVKSKKPAIRDDAQRKLDVVQAELLKRSAEIDSSGVPF